MNSKSIVLFILFSALFLLVGCGASQTSIDLAVCQTRMAEPTDTPVVEKEIQTVQVEATREVEITREIQVTRIVDREVTRIVEIERVITVTQLISPTPIPTLTPSLTPTSKPYVPPVPTVPATSKDDLLQAMRSTKEKIGTLGFLIDQALDRGWISCEEFVAVYEQMLVAPTFTDVPLPYQTEYNDYRRSISKMEEEATDMVGLCRDLITGVRNQPISPFIWTQVRTGVNQALDILNPAIERLENK